MNTAAIARGQYVPALASATAFLVANFYLIRRVAEANSGGDLVAYVVGGVVGDAVGIYISRLFGG